MSQTVHTDVVPSRAERPQPPDVYDDGRLRVEHENYYVSCGGESLKFPRTEFLLLSRLARNAERVVRAEELWRHAWGDSKPYNAESLHVHIYRLRGKLAPHRIQIETMVNVGYRLVLDADEATERRRESA
ncbi:MAG TPA: helix-turn-helix domain-containing protein [Pyrinomonadaceae bacterium]|jgi:DNA-binding response OmpR family regulator|nr:helix-turn-helix domain-containing protein [Pyrinomonadaceae bacterium]